MNPHFFGRSFGQLFSTTVLATSSVAVLISLGACGGGGGDAGGGAGGGGGDPGNGGAVTFATSSTLKFGQKSVVVVNQSDAAKAVTVSGAGCTTWAVSTDPAYVSTATTAYFECTVSTLGAVQVSVKRNSDGAVLASSASAVAKPEVTLTFSNAAGVSGNVVLALEAEKTPITVTNFLSYVNSGFYVGTVIHRVRPGFVIQGGGYTNPLNATTQVLKPTSAPIALEVNKGLSNTQWTIAMARTCEPTASATSQFFINLVDNSAQLDPRAGLRVCSTNPTVPTVDPSGYAVFGNVTTATTNVVSSIVTAPCSAVTLFSQPGECAPGPNVVITAAVQTQ
jgi:cyclophilin family peptidyl-prolyl cis-trans isomerase